MKKKEIIKIDLKYSDFIGTHYYNNYDCPLVRAAKRVFKTNDVHAGGTHITINNKRSNIVSDWDGTNCEKVEKYYRKTTGAKKKREWTYYVEIEKI